MKLSSITCVAAWRWVVLLALVSSLLLAINLFQLYRALSAPLRQANKELTATLSRVEDVSKARNRDDARLFADLDAIAKRGQHVRTEYRTVIKDRPMPAQCAPGQERVDAVNRGLSGRSGEVR